MMISGAISTGTPRACAKPEAQGTSIPEHHLSSLPQAALLIAAWALTFLLAATPLGFARAPQDFAPEAESTVSDIKSGTAQKFMAVTAHPLATEAAYKILKRSGSAVDAAIAAQLMLTLVEPQSSGIGGGAFMLYWDAKKRELSAYDGRETAPAAAGEDYFLARDGEPMDFFDAVIGGRSVGVPGVLKMLELAYKQHGKLPWPALFEASIRMAEQGFAITPRLHALIYHTRNLASHQATRNYFFTKDGKPLPIGHQLKNPQLADTLRKLAAHGTDMFYKGEIAAHILKTVRHDPYHVSVMTAEDLERYEPKVRPAVCGTYHQYTVCGAPPPSSGGIAVNAILGILQHLNLNASAYDSVLTAHLFAEASRLAFADRNTYVADPNFVPVPVEELIAPDYLRKRARLIHMDRSLGKAEPGQPIWDQAACDCTTAESLELPSTSHISIVDGEGNGVSMTSSIEHAFGSHIMVDGFLLNNQLTDFSFRPRQDGRSVANRVAGGKRPLSSMSPTAIFDSEGALKMLIGSPGGARIIDYVAQTILLTLTYGMSIGEAVAAPHVVNMNGATEIEVHSTMATLKSGLEVRGHDVQIVPETSGLHGIVLEDGILVGGADPRREGTVMGD